jgi:cold shock CspA family protein
MVERLTGRAKYETTAEGYGHIICDNPQYNKRDAYYWFKDIKEVGLTKLKRGQRVEFDLETGPKGPIARAIVLQ